MGEENTVESLSAICSCRPGRSLPFPLIQRFRAAITCVLLDSVYRFHSEVGNKKGPSERQFILISENEEKGWLKRSLPGLLPEAM